LPHSREKCTLSPIFDGRNVASDVRQHDEHGAGPCCGIAVRSRPEFGPLAAFAVGLWRRDFRLARKSAVALLVALPVAMVITMFATLLWEQFGWITLNGVEAIRNVEFIYEVGPFSLVVALLAGAAGMLAVVTAKSAALVGVFISVTTVPAAGFAVIAATSGQWHIDSCRRVSSR
jgi:uncharacterized hydrophobic protein (TIGR00271 family)